MFLNTLEIMKKDLALRLTSQCLCVWNTLSFVQLPKSTRLVNLLFSHCLLPTYHNNTLSREMAYLVDAVMQGHPLDIPSIMMIIEAKHCTANVVLPFKLLIMQLIHSAGFPISSSHDYETPMGNILIATLKQMNMHAAHSQGTHSQKPAQSSIVVLQTLLAATKFMVVGLHKLEQKVDHQQTTVIFSHREFS